MIRKMLIFLSLFIAESSSARDFTTIAKLKLSPGLTNYETCNLMGAKTVNDGGDGRFYWDSISTSLDDGGTIIKTASDIGRWIRISEAGTYKLAWFGINLDTSDKNIGAVTENTQIIDALLSTLSASHVEAKIILPTGTVSTYGGHVVPYGVDIIGQGTNKSIIKHAGNNSCFIATGADGKGFADRQTFQSFTIKGNSNSGASGFSIGDRFGVTVSRVNVDDYSSSIAVKMVNTERWTEGWLFETVEMHNNLIAFDFSVSPSGVGQTPENSFAFGEMRSVYVHLDPPFSKAIRIVATDPSKLVTVYHANLDLRIWFGISGGGKNPIYMYGPYAQLQDSRINLASDGVDSASVGLDFQLYSVKGGAVVKNIVGTTFDRSADIRSSAIIDPVFSSNATSPVDIPTGIIRRSGYATASAVFDQGVLLPNVTYKVTLSAQGPNIWGTVIYYVTSSDYNRCVAVDKISGYLSQPVLTVVPSNGAAPASYCPDQGQRMAINLAYSGTGFFYSYSVEKI